MKDPFISEVRKYREEHSRKFYFDIHAICNDLRGYQRELYESSEIDENRIFVGNKLGINETTQLSKRKC